MLRLWLKKVINILLALMLIALISFGHWYLFYEYPNFERWAVWYLGFSVFIIPVIIINKVFIEAHVIFRCFIVFIALVIGQSITDYFLIEYYFGGNFSEVYYFFLCMENSWGGNFLLSCLPFFSVRKNKIKNRKINSELIDDVEW